MSDDGSGGTGEDSVARSAQVVALVMLAALLGLLAAVLLAGPLGGRWSVPAAPAALAGLVAPVIGYRLYRRLLGAVRPGEGAAGRRKVFRRATIAALAVTAAIALLGLSVYSLSADWAALSGLVTHVLLTGAIWPSRARLLDFVEAP